MADIAEFKDAILPFLPTWKVIEIRAVADLETGSLLGMMACLTPNVARPLDATEAIQGIVFIREVWPISRLRDLLDGLEQGRVDLAGHKLSTSQFSNYQFQDWSHGLGDMTLGWPELAIFRSFVLRLSAPGNLETLLRPKSQYHIAQTFGFNSFIDMSLQRVQFRLGDSYGPKIEIAAPIFAELKIRPETAMLNPIITIHQELHPKDLSLSYRIQDRHGNKVVEQTINVEGFSSNVSGSFCTLDSAIALPPEAELGETHLYYRNFRNRREPIANALFAIPRAASGVNPRLDSLSSIINNTFVWAKGGTAPEELLKQWLGLTAQKPDERKFEMAIAMLLFLAGFSTVSIGEADGVDLLVMEEKPQPTAILISCTTSSYIGKKTSTLSMQRNRIRDMLAGFSISAVIAAPIELRDVNAGDLEDCRAAGVSLMLLPEIQALWDELRGTDRGQASERFLQMFTRLPSASFRG